MGVPSPTLTNHISSLLDIAQFDGRLQGDKLNVESDLQSVDTQRQYPNAPSIHSVHVFPVHDQSLDQSNAYNYSIGSNEYVQLHGWQYD